MAAVIFAAELERRIEQEKNPPTILYVSFDGVDGWLRVIVLRAGDDKNRAIRRDLRFGGIRGERR